MSDINNDKILAYGQKPPFSIDGLEEHLEPNITEDWLVIYDSLNGELKKIHPAALFSSAGAKGDVVNAFGHTFAVGEAVMSVSTGYGKAIASSQEGAEVVGVVSTVVDADTIVIQSSGLLEGLSGLTADTRYFLSDSVAGGLTSTPPTASGSVIQPVLYAISSTAGFIITNKTGRLIS